MADYLVATLRDRIQAEEVFLALQEVGILDFHLSIYGKGYKTGEECQDFDPAVITQKRLNRMMFFLLPLGFLGGVIFYQTVRIDLAPALGRVGNSVIGGLLGAASGALGGFSTAGGLSMMLDKTQTYAQQIESGKFLVVVQDANDLKMRQANRVLMTHNVEDVAFYERPD